MDSDNIVLVTGDHTPTYADDNTSTPFESPFDELRQFLCGRSGISVIRHILGVEPIPDAPELLSKAIINALDCENWERNQAILTEIGITAADSADLRASSHAPGECAENLLKQLYFYHYRIIPNAHLRNTRYCFGGPTANRFGHTRFVEVEEAKDALGEIFNWLINPSQPALGVCPVIFIGHAVKNDILILRRTLGVDAGAFDSIVMTIDTQILAQEVGLAPYGRQTKLSYLAEAHGFQCRDAHTAGNDAAYTMLTALYMALGSDYFTSPSDHGPTVQEVIDRIEFWSRQKDPGPVGLDKYCERCGARNSHERKECRKFVSCTLCAEVGKPKKIANCHRTEACQSVFL